MNEDHHLIVLASCLALSVEKTRPVLALKALLEVPVNEDLDIVTLGAHGEGGHLFRGREVAQNKGAEDGGERAPVTHNVTRLKAEGALVKRAHDGGALAQPTVLQGSAKVRAAVGNGEDLAIKVSRDQKGQAIDLHRDQIASGNVVRLQNGNPLLLLSE